MEYQSNNPIAIQSKRRLINSLLELMEEKPYHKINIQELATRAGMDRRTFYRNFDSKEDILIRYMDILGRKYLSLLRSRDELTILTCLHLLFDLVEEHKSFLSLLYKNNLAYFLSDYFNGLIPAISEIMEEKSGAMTTPDKKEEVAYIVTFNLGGFWSILIRWIGTGYKQDKEEIYNIISKVCY